MMWVKRWSPILVVLLLLGAAVPTTPIKPDMGKVQYKAKTWALQGNFGKCVLVDINLDGRDDLLLPGKNHLHLYYYKPGRGFADKPDQKIATSFDTILFDVANIDGDPQPEIVYVNLSGVWALHHNGKKFLRSPTLLYGHRRSVMFLSPSPQSLVQFDILTDIDGDGDEDLILPQEGNLLFLYNNGKGRFDQKVKLPLLMHLELTLQTLPSAFQAQMELETWFGPLQFIDYTGDKKTDIVYLGKSEIQVFPAGVDGRVTPGNSFTLSYPKERVKMNYLDRNPTRVEDLNGDGMLDLITVNGDDGKIKFYQGQKGKRKFIRPTTMISEKGWIRDVYLKDMNGDGSLDVAVNMLEKMSWKKAINIFRKKVITVYHKVYLNRSTKDKVQFTTSPNSVIELSHPLTIKPVYGNMKINNVSFVEFDYDFNGDARRDMFAMVGGRAVSIYMNKNPRKGPLFAKKATLTCTIPDPMPYKEVEYIASDWNRDGVLDFLLQYQHFPGKDDKLALFLSKKK